MTRSNLTRKQFLEQLQSEIQAFDTYMAAKYPLFSTKPVDSQGKLGFGDWFEQFLSFLNNSPDDQE